MKIVMIAASMVIAVVAIIFVVGALLPERHSATRSVFLKASPEQVFELITGPQDWRSDLKRYAAVEQGGKNLFVETDTDGQTITYERVEFTPPKLFKRRIADQDLPFGGAWTWRIEPQNGGCLVTITEDGEIYNPVFRFVSRFVLGYTRTIDSYLARLSQAAKKRAG